jgi:hypothetical protein
MMKTRSLIILSTAIVMGSVLMFGCTPSPTTLTSSPALTVSASSSHPAVTSTPMATSTATALPSSMPITPSPFPIPTLTLTSLPTLTVEERNDYTQELFRTNAGCELPCWWGFTPGISTWPEVEAFLQFIGARTGPYPLDDGSIFHGTGGIDIHSLEGVIANSVGFLEREGLIELIFIRSEGYSNPEAFQEQSALFSPKRIIEKYGPPSRVWLESSSSGPVTEGRVAGYTLWVYYDQFGFLILYNGYGEFSPTFHFCPRFENGKDIRSLKMYLQSPGNPNPVEGTAGTIGLEIDPFPEVQSIEEATGISVTEFYNLFAQEERPACFDTPRDIWP